MLEVGRVARPHGLKGEVLVEMVSNRVERLAPGAVLFTGSGELVVGKAVAHKGRFIVRFEGVSDRDGAEVLRGAVLSAAPLEDDDVLWIHELIGATVVDRRGTALGRITEIEANPASDLMVLDGGGLVPLRFVVENRPGRVVVEVPPGLLE